MPLCDFKHAGGNDYTCRRCGGAVTATVLPIRAVCKKHVEPPRDPLTCRHFRGPTGDSTETHKHCGCKTATPMTALAECELHGTCTFIGRAKDERIAFCGDCQDYSSST